MTPEGKPPFRCFPGSHGIWSPWEFPLFLVHGCQAEDGGRSALSIVREEDRDGWRISESHPPWCGLPGLDSTFFRKFFFGFLYVWCPVLFVCLVLSFTCKMFCKYLQPDQRDFLREFVIFCTCPCPNNWLEIHVYAGYKKYQRLTRTHCNVPEMMLRRGKYPKIASKHDIVSDSGII